jgi:hypothetical protein
MLLEQEKRAIGILSTEEDAKSAIEKLRADSFSLEQISLIGPNTCSYESQRNFALSPTSNYALISGLAVADVGSVFTTGALANSLANNAVGFLNKGLTGALVSLGMPENVAQFYSGRLLNGEFLLIVDGLEEQLDRAESVLRQIPVQSWRIYRQPSAIASTK